MTEHQKEIVPSSEDDMFIILNHHSTTFDYPIHYHDEYEINLVMGTSGMRIVGDNVQPFHDIDLVMIGKNLPHAWRGDTIEGNRVITIQFSAETLNLKILNKRLFSHIKQLLIDSQQGLLFSKETMEAVKDKIIKLTQLQGFDSLLGFFSLLSELANAKYTNLISKHYDISKYTMTAKSRRINHVIQYLQHNYMNDVSLSHVAELVGMSGSAFSHFFKNKTNCTYIDYINGLRIGHACQMLADTNYTVAEICYHCGFNNMSNFIRMFRKQKNMTPTEYRDFIAMLLIKY